MVATHLPAVTLIVLNWNGRHHLDSCLSSLLNLDYPADKLELILCDNGSSDGSAAYVQARFPGVHVIQLERNHGFALGNNLAAQRARGEWLGFLNNDMWVEPTWLADLLSTLNDHSRACCIGSRIKNWDGSTLDFVGGGVNYQGHGFQIDHGKSNSPRDIERRVLFACGGAMLIRRDVFVEMGGFDPDYFAFFEDVDLGWRLNLLGREVWYTPRGTAYHRHHGTAGMVPPHRLHVLYERNALFTIYKCFSDQTLARVLPTALMLINERALSISGVDRAEFQINVQESPEEVPAGPESEPLPARARRVLREEGAASALTKTGSLLRYHARRVASRAFLGVGRGLHLELPSQLDPGVVVWPRVAASQYIAISEFARALDTLNTKRRWLQQRRQVSDQDLMPLFEDPFFANYREERYSRFYGWITRTQGLDGYFTDARD